jgi:hypothetical protein
MSVWETLTDQLAVFVDRTTGEPKGTIGERFVEAIQPSRSEVRRLAIVQVKRTLLGLWQLLAAHWKREFVSLSFLRSLVKRACVRGAFSAGVYLIVCGWILFLGVLVQKINSATS